MVCVILKKSESLRMRTILGIWFLFVFVVLGVACRNMPTATPTSVAPTVAAPPVRLSDVTPPVVRASSPLESVQNFYRWYLDYAGELGTEDFRDPLANRAYAYNGYVKPELVEAIDTILLELDDKGLRSFDPLLCTLGELPSEVVPDGSFDNQGSVLMVARTDLERHFFTIHLQLVGDVWQIADISCAGTPEGVTTAFYVWYLSRQGNENPLATGSYQEAQFLSPEFIQQIDSLVQSGDLTDPFLPNISAPQKIRIVTENPANTVLVHITTSSGEKTVRVKLIHIDQLWYIHGITAVP